ncbi:MAG: peptide MFS transporter [Bacteroidaceae bacterium]|nr:peptide MFS transporter [Prevotellaceae bacterium]MDD7526281.1 peptide MFS transporter [Prevotellaceae bacterium]MDY5759691.1 peptide MFS transporter [Bacteroidaceae bacterium]
MAQKGHPKGLYLLFVTEMAERFSYYGMRALFVLYLVAAFFNSADASQIYGSYTGLVYLTPLLGGYIADRYWGNRRSIIVGGIVMAIGQFLMFASACVVQQSIFSDPATGGVISESVNNGLAMTLMFTGLGALIIGNGFFKPNISTMVGDLYAPQDHRKDSAFTIFYMGINTGALIAPLVCGSVAADGNWMNPGAFKWGFFCAGVAMILSVVVFMIGKKKYLNTPEGLPIGLPPAQSQLLMLKDMQAIEEELELKGEMPKNPDNAMPKPVVKNSPLRLWGCLIGAIALFIVFSLDVDNFNDYISAAIYAISIVLPIFIITDKGLTNVEKQRIGVIYIIAVFVIFFWSAFEQAGSSLTIFADQQCDRTIGNWEMPTTWFQSINPIVVVAFAPIMATLWETLAKHKLEPASPVKQAIGLLLLAIGYAIIAFGTDGLADGQKASMWWLFALYFIHTIGELSLSPIGLSMVNKLSPVHLASLLMGVWFMSNAASNILAGKLATLLPTAEQPVHSFLGYQITNLTDFFTLFAVMAGAAAILLFCLCPLLKKMMKGVE